MSSRSLIIKLSLLVFFDKFNRNNQVKMSLNKNIDVVIDSLLFLFQNNDLIFIKQYNNNNFNFNIKNAEFVFKFDNIVFITKKIKFATFRFINFLRNKV